MVKITWGCRWRAEAMWEGGMFRWDEVNVNETIGGVRRGKMT